MAGKNDLDTTTLALSGFVSAVLCFAIFAVAYLALHRSERADFQKRVVESAPLALYDLQDGQRQKLSKYRWIDREKGLVAIPIERAKTIVARELN